MRVMQRIMHRVMQGLVYRVYIYLISKMRTNTTQAIYVYSGGRLGLRVCECCYDSLHATDLVDL